MPAPTFPARRLELYVLTCSAAGAAVLTGAGKAQAAIVYSGIVNRPIQPQAVNGGLYIDFEDALNWGDGTRATGWDANPYFTGVSLYVAASTQFVANGAGNAANLAALDLIGAGSNFTSEVAKPVDIAAGQTGFIGFRFDPDTIAGVQTYYGWMRMSVGADLNTAGAVVDWAYDDSGAPIAAGVVPEPSSLALLAMGAAGLTRRRRSAVAA